MRNCSFSFPDRANGIKLCYLMESYDVDRSTGVKGLNLEMRRSY
jgi:hypothetical protein